MIGRSRPAMWRHLGCAVSAVIVVVCLGSTAHAEDARRTAMSLVGEPKYHDGFQHFDWVNPQAPKGGRVRQTAIGSFDSLNEFPAQGEPAGGLTLVYDTLFSRDPNEAATGYALVAAWASYPSDYSSVSFGLRPEARFNDGQQITVEDVIYSFDVLKKVSPLYSTYYQHVLKAEKTGDREVKFTFDMANNRELPQITSELPIVPKHWWEGKTANGEPRDIAKSSLELPVGSGPYRVKSVEPGRGIIYERVKDWWAADLPVGRGQYNFDEIEITYYRDFIAPFEAFKRGDTDFWTEPQAKNWATQYNFDAVKRGLVVKQTIPVNRVAAMQAFVMNTRKPVFQDVRVRRALTLAFDFNWENKNLFFGLYSHLGSYFDDSDLASSKLPEGRELEILNEVKADLPAEVFTTDYKATFHNVGDDNRRNLAVAAKLLRDANYTNRNGVLTSPSGVPLTFEFLLDNPSYERVVLPYRDALAQLGIRMTVRTVDSAQYQRRHDDFDFDMILGQFPQSESPGNEQMNFFGSSSVAVRGSHNLAGVHDKAIDTIIGKVINARDRADLVAATRALDRALLWNFYAIPTWYKSGEWVAFWDIFGRPEKLPSRGVGFLQTWWFDADKVKAMATARGT